MINLSLLKNNVTRDTDISNGSLMTDNATASQYYTGERHITKQGMRVTCLRGHISLI